MDHVFQDLMRLDQLMGDILTFLCGDFKQIFPVVKYGACLKAFNAKLKTLYLWRNTTWPQTLGLSCLVMKKPRYFLSFYWILGMARFQKQLNQTLSVFQKDWEKVFIFRETQGWSLPMSCQYGNKIRVAKLKELFFLIWISVLTYQQPVNWRIPCEEKVVKFFDCADKKENAVSYPMECWTQLSCFLSSSSLKSP